MRVMVIVKATDRSEAGEMPSAELLEQMGAFNDELVKSGVMQDGAGLKPTSQGVRVRFTEPDREVTEGPFKEPGLIAGYWIWQVKDMADAIAWARRCPNPHPDSPVRDIHIEIRPLYEEADFVS